MNLSIIKHLIIWVVIWVIIASVGACHAIRFQGSLQLLTRTTCATGYCPVEYFDTSEGKVIRIVAIGDTAKKPLLLIHGSPSSLMEWTKVISDTAFVKNYYVIVVDRPGYGLADFGNLEMDLHKQTEMLHHILLKAGVNKPVSVVGSSYGGTIAACYAMDYPKDTRCLVLMYASTKPGAEKTYGISYALNLPLIERLTPTLLCMPAYEKFNHQRLLQTLNKWDSIKSPTLVIHGTADSLIYYSNALFAQQSIKNAQVTLKTLPGYRHGIMFSHPDLMKDLLRDYLKGF